MQWRLRPVLSHAFVVCMVAGTTPALFCLPRTVYAQASPAPPSLSQNSDEEGEPLPLTTAQQEARALATVLIGKKSSTTVPLPSTPLEHITEQSLRPGKRLVIVLKSWHGGQLRLVSGQQTFASPIDVTLPVLIKHDLPPPKSGDDTALALEVLAE